MKKILLALTIVSTVIFFGCKGGAGGNPTEVLSTFFEALAKKDMEAAGKLATKDSKSMLDMMSMAMKSDKGDVVDKYDKSKMVFGEAKIDGDVATVPVKEKENGELINYKLKKEDGNWKVAFDKASLMSMGMEKMSEKGVDPQEKIDEAMKQMNSVNMDSLKEELQKNMPEEQK